MSLIHLHAMNVDHSDLYLNPEHIVAMLSDGAGTKITTVECQDEGYWRVLEPLGDIVHAVIVAANSDSSRVVVPG